jgi:hypothetical protein
MIKFFRKIRQRLLTENKFSRYLIYAAGEILLVMIGILLALQVSNWNTAKQNRGIERNFLKNLKVDLDIDLYNLDSLSKDRMSKTESAFKLLKLPGATTIKELITLDSLYWNVFSWTSFIPRTTTRQELISAGQLSIIQNDSIKALILILNQENDKIVVSRDHMRREYEYYLYDRSMNNSSFMAVIDLEATWKLKKMTIDTTLTKQQIESFYEESHFIQNDRVIKNGLKLASGNNRYIKSQYDNMKLNIEKLIRLINTDLNNN